MTQAEKDRIIKANMKNLNLTEQEALELFESDRAVDRMTMAEINAELTPEQKAAIKKAKATGTRKAPTVYKWDKKAKKVDNEKAEIITKLFNFILNEIGECEIVNAEREISFTIGANSYSLTLTKHRNKG